MSPGYGTGACKNKYTGRYGLPVHFQGVVCVDKWQYEQKPAYGPAFFIFMILIIESGATKTDWRGILSSGEVLSSSTSGMNLATMSEEHIENALDGAADLLRAEEVTEYHVYAAGMLPGASTLLEGRLRCAFPRAEGEYLSDLMASARALLGHGEGIACIIGTGSNSGLYDGKEIRQSIPGGGFILGDEGSASRLGKLFISDFLKGLVSEDVASDMRGRFNLGYPEVVKAVYRSGAGAAYLGSFAPAIMEWYPRSEYVKSLVDSNFRDFFERCLLRYERPDAKVGIVGGFAAACRDIILDAAALYGMAPEIVASPIDGLVKFHSLR